MVKISEHVLDLLDSSRLRRLVWVCGGVLWLIGLGTFWTAPGFSEPSAKLLLESTVIGGDSFAVINGTAVRVGEPIATDAGIFRVESIEPGRAVLRKGPVRWKLELSLRSSPLVSSGRGELR